MKILSLRLHKDIYDKVSRLAETDDRSINHTIARILKQHDEPVGSDEYLVSLVNQIEELKSQLNCLDTKTEALMDKLIGDWITPDEALEKIKK